MGGLAVCRGGTANEGLSSSLRIEIIRDRDLPPSMAVWLENSFGEESAKESY